MFSYKANWVEMPSFKMIVFETIQNPSYFFSNVFRDYDYVRICIFWNLQSSILFFLYQVYCLD